MYRRENGCVTNVLARKLLRKQTRRYVQPIKDTMPDNSLACLDIFQTKFQTTAIVRWGVIAKWSTLTIESPNCCLSDWCALHPWAVGLLKAWREDLLWLLPIEVGFTSWKNPLFPSAIAVTPQVQKPVALVKSTLSKTGKKFKVWRVS